MEIVNGFDMKFKRFVFWFLGFSMLFIIYKLSVIETDVERLQFLKETLMLNKEQLQLSHQQLILIEHLYRAKTGTSLPIIYAVTPTYKRLVQKAELTRISQTLALVPNIHWIVVEDSEQKTELVVNLLKDSHLLYTHLAVKTPTNEQWMEKIPKWKRHRGVEQRNAALNWLRSNFVANRDKGVVYFMDDDNTYSIKLFSEIAKVNKVGVWPVGLVGGLNAEAPIIDSKTVTRDDFEWYILCSDWLSASKTAKSGRKMNINVDKMKNSQIHNSKVSGYRSGWRTDRPFAIDMAGFAINLELILSKPEALFSYRMEKGMQESEFLNYFTKKEELEPLADNCTKVYVWHTQTVTPVVKGEIPGLEV